MNQGRRLYSSRWIAKYFEPPAFRNKADEDEFFPYYVLIFFALKFSNLTELS